MRHRFEEKLGAIGGVNTIVSGGAEFRLLHSRGAAAQVSDAGGPDFLPLDRREQSHASQRDRRQILRLKSTQKGERLGMFEDLFQSRHAGRFEVNDR